MNLISKNQKHHFMTIKNRASILAMLPFLLLAASCDPFNSNRIEPEPSPAEVEGWVPVYASAEDVGTIASKDAKPIDNGGKIYVKGNTLYQVEVGKGIHVIDIQNPNNPHTIKFIQVIIS